MAGHHADAFGFAKTLDAKALEMERGRSAPRRARSLVAAVAVALVAFVAIAPGCVPEEQASTATKGPLTETIRIKEKPFALEVARDDKTREKGLGGRATLGDDAGMIFIFPDSRPRSFWMLDTLIDLDIIYVDPLGYVTAVHRMPAVAPRGKDESIDAYHARLKLYPSVSPAQFAIELKAGKAEELGIKPNEKIPADWERLKKLAR
ncbi:MAG: DUF192 domain-containing protein [Phycisphaerales bacterium]|jgi:uncharacterized membrane protein (UPF0127 family)